MPDLYSLIKQAAVQAVEASDPVTLVIGSVVTKEPLMVSINQHFTLDEAFLILPRRLKEEVQAGDGVVLLREQGGQRYLMLDVL